MRHPLRAAALLVLTLAFGVSGPAPAQVDIFSLETAFIFNFTAFTGWPPPQATPAHLNVCVSAKSELAGVLAKLDGRAVAGRSWHLLALAEDASPSGCEVLVVDGNTPDTGAFKAALAAATPMLVVRAPDAAPGPYVIQLLREGDELRFDIDNTEAARRHLALSSKLLRLARKVT